jgi:hypothetical protein
MPHHFGRPKPILISTQMKKIKFALLALTMILLGTVAKAGTYTFTVNIPYGLCSYQVCAFVDYLVGTKGGSTGYSTAPICANISIGGSHTYTINTPTNSNYLGVHFIVSGGDFYHIFGSNSEYLSDNCNNMSNPFTEWTNLGGNSWELWSDNILGPGK